jgi:Ca-activated chloride channel family protein
MKFANPFYLLLIFIPLIYLFLKYKRLPFLNISLSPTLFFSSGDIFSKKSSPLAKIFHPVSDTILTLALIFFIIALARPLGGHSINNEKYYGIDIILAVDVSGSMLNVDLVPSSMPYRDVQGQRYYFDSTRSLIRNNRLNSAKNVIKEYINKQTFNRIGLVLFAGYSYTKCPLTLDKNMLDKIIDDVNFTSENDGTAIGMGIATSINRLRKSDAKSKVIILLTDGINNSGMIDPLSAANIARDLSIRVYAIGMGNPDGYLQPVNTDFNEYVLQMGAGLDEKNLQSIADTTGGKFYRAYDPDSLRKIYNDIDKLEKSKIEIKRRVLYNENFMPFLIIGFVLFIAYILFNTIIIRIP